MSWLTAIARETFRWYLRRFPLRDGKNFCYQALNGRLAPANGAVVARLVPGFVMKLDLEDPVQRKIYFYGNYDERYEARMVRRLLAPGEVFWDIGANIGYFSLLAAATLQHTGRVVAFEPGGAAYARLVDNVALNPYRNITPYNLAVLDQAGEAVLYLAAHLADGCASLYGSRPEQSRQTCRTITLDAFARREGLEPPHFLKIDVEGAELRVLQGAAGTIAAARPLLLVEMKDEALRAGGTSKDEVQEFLEGHGYRAAFPHRRRWHLAADLDQAPGRNILWFNPASPTHREKVRRLPLRGPY